MKLIALTSPSFFEGEVNFLDFLATEGVDLIHFRKPDAPIDDCERIIANISHHCKAKTVVHQHFSLATKYGLHGIHINRRNPSIPPFHQGSVSRSCHTLDEVQAYKASCDYVFLSPIFDSISKRGYRSAFTDNMLTEAANRGVIDEKVYALGGISCDNICQLCVWRFGGAAMLGSISRLARLPRKDARLELRKILQAVHSC